MTTSRFQIISPKDLEDYRARAGDITVAFRRVVESPRAGGGDDHQTLSRSDDDPRLPRRIGRVDWNEIPTKRIIRDPQRAQPNEDES